MNEIKELTKKEIAINIRLLEEELESRSRKRYIPKVGEKYYSISSVGEIERDKNENHDFDEYMIRQRNCFKTEEEAERKLKYLEYVCKINNYIEENWFLDIDWEDEGQCEYEIYYNVATEKLGYICLSNDKYLLVINKLPNYEAYEDVTKKFKEELLYIFKY